MFLSGMVGTASGGSEKKYKITTADSSYDILDEASPGAIVYVGAEGPSMVVKTSNGLSIPWLNALSTTRAAGSMLYFVMPAEDVTIS